MLPLGTGEHYVCVPQQQRVFLTSSASSTHGNVVNYGTTYGLSAAKSFALGESSTSGSFGGAGINGGANVMMLINSCGFRSHTYLQDMAYMHAGVHMVMVSMPIAVYVQSPSDYVGWSDTAQWSSRGSTIANALLANLNAEAQDTWLSATMVDNGYLAIQGTHDEGANIVVSRNVSSSAVTSSITESWAYAEEDSRDATGSSWWEASWECNYNCTDYGW